MNRAFNVDCLLSRSYGDDCDADATCRDVNTVLTTESSCSDRVLTVEGLRRWGHRRYKKDKFSEAR